MTAESGAEGPGRFTIESRRVHRGPVVDLRVDTVRFPDGSVGEMEVVRHSGAAAVLPVLTPRGVADPEIVLLRQFRYAAGGELFEVPAGRPDRPGEPWEECARRELQEETGLVAGTLEPLTSILTTPGFTDERIHLFVARELTDGRTATDADEFIAIERMPLSRALERIRTGAIVDAKTIATILFAERFGRL